MEGTHSACMYPPASPTRAVMLLVVALAWGLGAGTTTMAAAFEGSGEGVRGWCGERRGVGDKWFNGCQWCVCTVQGPQCSSSSCSGLVRQVPVCHVVGQRWTDGCYRCRCKRQGITCRLHDACRLLTLQPVPCLADDRCVCGPDGVPSCTAAVIDRNAYAARRIHLGKGFPVTPAAPRAASHRRHHRGGGRRGDGANGLRRYRRSLLSGQRQDVFSRAGGLHLWNDDVSREREDGGAFPPSHSTRLPSPSGEGQTTQELLITSDNLCRFGARWYGGSLRCFCDLDGAIACGNPVFIMALFDDFRVQAERCEEGHVWEDGCRVCTCQVSGLIFCQHSGNCPHQPPLLPQPTDMDDDDDDEEEEDDFGDDLDDMFPEEESEGVVNVRRPPMRLGPTSSSAAALRGGGGRCEPGARWRQGCLECRCTHHARPLCNPHHCGRRGEVDLDPGVGGGGPFRPHLHGNRAREVPATLPPPEQKRFRGPMMVAPKPAGPYRPPAYASSGPAAPAGLEGTACGRFSVGVKYWDDCNLCLCTRRGPRCQGKLCR